MTAVQDIIVGEKVWQMRFQDTGDGDGSLRLAMDVERVSDITPIPDRQLYLRYLIYFLNGYKNWYPYKIFANYVIGVCVRDNCESKIGIRIRDGTTVANNFIIG